MFLWHVTIALVQLQRPDVVLQQLEVRIDGDTVVGPLEAHFLIVVRNWWQNQTNIIMAILYSSCDGQAENRLLVFTHNFQCKSDRFVCPSGTTGTPFGRQWSRACEPHTGRSCFCTASPMKNYALGWRFLKNYKQISRPWPNVIKYFYLSWLRLYNATYSK